MSGDASLGWGSRRWPWSRNGSGDGEGVGMIEVVTKSDTTSGIQLVSCLPVFLPHLLEGTHFV